METVQNEVGAMFLLGKLSDEEQEAVEREYFHKTEAFENILIAENTLTDAYVSGRLSTEDRVLFENRLMINPRQRKRAAFAETLVKYASRMPVEESVSPTFRSKCSTIIARFFSVQPLLSYSLATVAILFFAAGVYWWASNDSGRPANEDLARSQTPDEIGIKNSVTDKPIGEQEPAAETDKNAPLNERTADTASRPRSNHDPALPQKELPQQRKPHAIISTIVLTPGSTRDAATAKAFIIPEKTSFVNLQLRFDDDGFPSYFVVVETADGQQVWNGKILRSREINNEKTVTITVPASRLRRGDHIISLKGLNKEGSYESVADYSFTVDRR